jgi:hypothetical protein
MPKKQVTHVELHDGFFVPGMGATGGQFKKTLPPEKSLKNFKMFLEDNGSLTLNWEEGKFTKEITIGAANVKVAVHVPNVTDTPKTDK